MKNSFGFFVALCLLPVSALGQVEELVVSTEIATPELPRDQDILDGYERSNIRFITYHHEGFGPGIPDIENLTETELKIRLEDNYPEYERRRNARLRFERGIEQWVENINNGHRTHERNPNLGMIAYHIAVHPDGSIARGRPASLAPGTWATSSPGQYPDFSEHFAVVSLGDHNYEPMTDAAFKAYIAVISTAQRQYRVPASNILPHQHHAGTSCPGVHLESEHENIIRRVVATSLQVELANRGCAPGVIDGILGQNSMNAYQRLVTENPESLLGQPLDDELLLRLLDNPNLLCR